MPNGKMELSGPNAGKWVPEAPESPVGTFEYLAKTATGWGKVVCEITLWGLRNKVAGHNRMPEAYDQLITAAHEWQRPQREIDEFVEAKAIVPKMREQSKLRSPLRGKRKGPDPQLGPTPDHAS